MYRSFARFAGRRWLAPTLSQPPPHNAWPGRWCQSSTRALPSIVQDGVRQRWARDLYRSKGRFGATRGPRDGRQNALREHLLIGLVVLDLLIVNQERVNQLLQGTLALLGEDPQAFVRFLRQFKHLAHERSPLW